MRNIHFLISIIFLATFACNSKASKAPEVISAYNVLNRVIGEDHAKKFQLELVVKDSLDYYSINTEGDKVIIQGTSSTTLTRGAYDYLKNATHSIISWSGNRINIPDRLPQYKTTVKTPFKFRYYLNTVTHGYSTPYWGWERWEKEIDWMAMHGFNMPLIAGAHEAILFRTFKKLGLTDEEVLQYFSGPAHFPWNRMGNIGSWDGPPPLSFFDKQIDLAHKMQNRMAELGMSPIVHAFAGFVPEGIQRIFPDEDLRELGWGGFEEKVQILSPKSALFYKIGKLYIEEWEKEFGKGEYYLADSFNEMDVPLSQDPEVAKEELAKYGEAVFSPIAEANPNAVWVMQGWTFPYHRDKNGDLFWTPDRLQAMMSGIPDDKLLILDMANEYNALFWKIPYSWKMYKGFFGKQWIYSFIPNMGGKVPLNGVLDFYAKAPHEVLEYKDKGNLVGFGFAPEGIENNEIIYELLADWAWRTESIPLPEWIASYCKSRYGAFPTEIKKAYDLLQESALGTFTDHPRFRYQFRPTEKAQGTVDDSENFDLAVHYFLKASDNFDNSLLYEYDAIELGTQLIGLKTDEIIAEATALEDSPEKWVLYQKAIDNMRVIDRLLASHPSHQLEKWVELARDYGDNDKEKLYYESNAKRLITTWGAGVNDYSARTWSGLVGDYYAERWQKWLDAKIAGNDFDIKAWEENWITSRWENRTKPYDHPLNSLKQMIQKLEKTE
ncbi:alpha-N-acetylglucosaminidase [Echinicola pacifica]|uniref:Alpha-N-acetylglucosaminidase n=1 Tax=Echinicola pacifica TaxID=346377 RepID=A0A918UIP3_9BACT|nr:alpha-N-acetylglucosaminidase [Echinicola pacifica]GGZ13051.1 alpha-N-acetylglucosaminidase [Echinicola pacifica]